MTCKAQRVIKDRGGGSTPKTTIWCADPELTRYLQGTIGTLPLAQPTGVKSVGFNEDGTSKASALERYPLAIVTLLGQVHAMAYAAKRAMHETPTDTVVIRAKTAQPVVHATPAPDVAPVATPATQQSGRSRGVTAPARVDEQPVSRLQLDEPGAVEALDQQERPYPADERALQFETEHPKGTRVRVQWEESTDPYYDGVVQSYGVDEEDGVTHLVRVKYDLDKQSIYHSTLPAADGGTDITKLDDLYDAQGVNHAAYEPFLAPVIATAGDLEEADSLVATVQLGELNVLCSTLGPTHREVYDQFFHQANAPGLYVAEYQLYDITDGALVQKQMITASDGKKAVELNLDEASRLHEPKNEREFKNSPDRARWQTAREFKMEEYQELRSFKVVSRKGISRKDIMRVKWVNAIKRMMDKAKFNPRLCIVGTGMSKEIFKSFQQVARTTSVNILTIIFCAYMKFLEDIQMDDSNAFQATRTDTDSPADQARPKLYAEMAPGFVEYDADGVPMIYELLTSFQGRIDASYLYGMRKKEILKLLGFHPKLWDPEIYEYHNTSVTGTAAPMSKILEAAQTDAPAACGHPPVGYMTFARHIDDNIGYQSRGSKIAEYLRDHPKNIYACTLTGWKKVLGWETTIDREEQRVVYEARDVLARIKNDYLAGAIIIHPRHAATPAAAQLEAGCLPGPDDPEYASYAEMQRITSKGTGLLFWISEHYPQVKWVAGRLGSFMHNGSWPGYRVMLHVFMHLMAHPIGHHFGHPEVRSLEHAGIVKQPVLPDGRMDPRLMTFFDANVGERKNATGIVGLLGGSSYDNVSQSQLVKSGESHTAEVMAGTTGTHRLIVHKGFIQEMHVPQPEATAMITDSATTIYVANNDAAAGRSLWLRRRIHVLHANVEDETTVYTKIPEALNISDAHTKYLVYPKWIEHVKRILNVTDADIKKITAIILDEDLTLVKRPAWAQQLTQVEARSLLAKLRNDASLADELAEKQQMLQQIIDKQA